MDATACGVRVGGIWDAFEVSVGGISLRQHHFAADCDRSGQHRFAADSDPTDPGRRHRSTADSDPTEPGRRSIP